MRNVVGAIHTLIAGVNAVLVDIYIDYRLVRQQEKVMRGADNIMERQAAGLLVFLR